MNVIEIKVKSGNRTPEIVELLRNCPDDTTVRFEPGTYDFYAAGVRPAFFCAPAVTKPVTSGLSSRFSIKRIL